MNDKRADVAIIMGSQSDWATMRHAAETLAALGISHDRKIISAHRTPDRLFEFAKGAKAAGYSVIIAGAGPVGVVAALACAQHGYAVTLLEAEAEIDRSPRAATTHPSTLEMIARVGLIEPFIREGLVARYFQFWDKPSRTRIVEFDHDVLRDETPYPFVVQTEQHKLALMGIERLRTLQAAEVHERVRSFRELTAFDHVPMLTTDA